MSTRRPLRSSVEFCCFLSDGVMAPATVVDVGAAWGTEELLSFFCFPKAHHTFIDPVPFYANRLQQLLNKYRGEYIPAALSDPPGTMRMRVLSGEELVAELATEAVPNTIDVTVD